MIWHLFKIGVGIGIPLGFLVLMLVLAVRESVREYRKARANERWADSPPVVHQWYLDGEPIDGATLATQVHRATRAPKARR